MEELKAKKVVNFGKGFMVNVGGVKKNQGAAASNDESESGSSRQMFKLGSNPRRMTSRQKCSRW